MSDKIPLASPPPGKIETMPRVWLFGGGHWTAHPSPIADPRAGGSDLLEALGFQHRLGSAIAPVGLVIWGPSRAGAGSYAVELNLGKQTSHYEVVVCASLPDLLALLRELEPLLRVVGMDREGA